MMSKLSDLLDSSYGIRVDSIERITSGFTNPNYLVSSMGNRYVARVSSPDRTGHLRFELDVLDGIRNCVPFAVPKPVMDIYENEFTLLDDGSSLTLFEYIQGECALDSWDIRHRNDHSSVEFGGAIGELHRCLSSLEVPETDYTHRNLLKDYLTRFKKYEENYSGKEWEDLLLSDLDSIREHTSRFEMYMKNSGNSNDIVHTDLRLDNILTDKNKVSAILDFDDIITGDHAYDLAKILVEVYIERGGDVRNIADLVDVEGFSEFTKSYFAHSGKSASIIRRTLDMTPLPAIHVLSIVGRDPDFDDDVRTDNVKWYSDLLRVLSEEDNIKLLHRKLVEG